MSVEGLENIEGVKLPKVSQIGIVAPDIGKAVRYYSKILNIKPWFRSKTTSNNVVFKGESFSLDLDIALAFSGGMEIELIQMLTDRGCIYSDIMKKQGGGLHHIGAMVWGFDKKLEQMKAAGLGVIQSGVIKTVGGVDAAIVAGSEVANDFNVFFSLHDQIRAVFFNGARAEALFRRFVLPGLPQVRNLPLLRLPSTSPANARLTRNDKLDAWRALVDALKYS